MSQDYCFQALKDHQPLRGPGTITIIFYVLMHDAYVIVCKDRDVNLSSTQPMASYSEKSSINIMIDVIRH